MNQALDLSIDVINNTIIIDDYQAIKVPKCKGLAILDFLTKHINQIFSPTLLRMNIENKEDVHYMQEDEYAVLINQACTYIPATDRKTIIEVIKQIKRNIEEYEVAKFNHDESRCQYLQDQNEQLQDYISKAVNSNKTIRNLNQAKANNSKSVKRALKHLIQYIEAQNPSIAKSISDRLVVTSQFVYLGE